MIFFSFSEKTSCIIMAGGIDSTSVKVLTGDLKTIKLPDLPEEIDDSSMVLYNKNILVCGGQNNDQKCL